MIDLTPLKNYVINDTIYDNTNKDLIDLIPNSLQDTDNGLKTYIKSAISTIDEKGFKAWFDNQLHSFLDCSVCFSSGRRIIQSNFIHYKYEITTILNMIEKYAEDDKDYYYELLLLQHKANLEFEAVNGLEYDVKETTKKKTTRTRNKQTSLIDKPKKETFAERKLKAHIAKINSFSIKIKPVRNDNTL